MPRLLVLLRRLALAAVFASSQAGTASAVVDIFNPEPVLPSGGISGIMMNNYPWSRGMITYPPSHIAVGTTVPAMGYAEPIQSLGLPPRIHVVLYSIVLNVHTLNVRGREIRTLYSTRPATTLSHFPGSVDQTKGLRLYVLHMSRRPNTTAWNGPYSGTISGYSAAFALPPLQFSSNHATFIFAIAQ